MRGVGLEDIIGGGNVNVLKINDDPMPLGEPESFSTKQQN